MFSYYIKCGMLLMGGVVILVGIWVGYLGVYLVGLVFDGEGIGVLGLLVLGLVIVLGGVGFIDDLIKICRLCNFGLNKMVKIVG